MVIRLFVFLSVAILAYSAHADCVQQLSDAGYSVKRLAPFSDGRCGIDDPVLVYATPSAKFSSPITLSCKFARKVGEWAQDMGAQRIDHVGGYNCRKIAGSIFWSQHSYGNAIDVTAIDGVPISKQWRSAYKTACRHFTTAIGPGHDLRHQHHLHIDNGWGFGCIADIVR